MKIALAVIFIALAASLSFAQDFSIEKNFEKNRSRLKLEKFQMGEDESSGYDYFIYTDKGNVVKIRSVWNGGASSQPSVDDYYFKDGKLVLYVKMPARKSQYKRLAAGLNIPLAAERKLYLKDSKLTAWIENGKTIPASDDRWNAKEKDVLDMAKAELENYQSMKEEND